MNISIFHYHLNPGGVTRIIESQVAAMKNNYPEARIQIITGHCENKEYYSKLGVKLLVNPKLNYLEYKTYTTDTLESLHDEIFNWINSNISNDEILHVHNLNLGKNPVLTLVFTQFLDNGFKLINHAHDFAEDRPKNFEFLKQIIENFQNKKLSEVLYPKNNKYIIGVLNQADYKRVLSYGIEGEQTFLWPNPVFVELNYNKTKSECHKKLKQIFNTPEQNKIITYPVRVIQRKNIGELILLAYLFQDSCSFMVTLPPRNPVEIEPYEKWKQFCIDKNIPLTFEAGTRVDFETIIIGSDYCITTSLKEGFGMSYLEPWLMGTPVIGRNIAYVTADIMEKGVTFPLLYNELIVPNNNGIVDFKLLDIVTQQAVIIKLIEGNIDKQEIFRRNNFLVNFPPEISSEEIFENQDTIKKQFSLDKYAERIFNAYKTIS